MIKLVGQEVCTLQSNKTSKSITKLTMVLIGLSFLWKKPCQFRKSIRLRCCDPWFSSGTKPHRVAMASETLSLKRVFSPHLDPEKHWYTLNSRLCCSKSAASSSTSSANLFLEEYTLVFLRPTARRWSSRVFRRFWQFRSIEKVKVALAFGLLLGILRLQQGGGGGAED